MILVTGGTGLVGAHLLFTLLQKNKKVRAIYRSLESLENVKNVFSYYTTRPNIIFDKIDWIKADVTQVPSLSNAFLGVQQVYHCAACVSFNPKDHTVLRKTNVEGTANIVNLCLANKVENLCHVSSIAALSNSAEGKSITEETSWNPEENHSVYAITKYGAEMEVWRGIQEGLRAVIISPGVILGEGFWSQSSGIIFERTASGTKYFTSGSTGFVDVKDVVRAMIQLTDTSVSNEKYILVGTNLSYKSLLEKLAISFKTPRPTISIRKNSLVFLSFLERIAVFFGRQQKLNKTMIRSLYTHRAYNSSKIEKQLGFKFTSIDDTLKRVVNNYLKNKI